MVDLEQQWLEQEQAQGRVNVICLQPASDLSNLAHLNASTETGLLV